MLVWFARPLFTRYWSRRLLWLGCDSFVCHYPDIFTMIFVQYMHLFTAQNFKRTSTRSPICSSGRRVKFCQQYKCFNLTPLHPHLGALCFWSFQGGGPCSAWHLVENFFMYRLSFSTSAPTPASMNVLCYRSRDRLLTVIVVPFGAYEKYGHFF